MWRALGKLFVRGASEFVETAVGKSAMAKPILEGFGLSSCPNELVLGTFDQHLTVYDQQVKSLNLAFRLKEHKVIPCDKPVVVVGGGIAGLTFAAGCCWLGQEVHLIEKQLVPCHLQRGCDIRWLHPHIYHWPSPGAEQPFAGLPLLSWCEGTASEVARQITSEWDRIAAAAKSRHLLTEVYGGTLSFLSRSPLQVEWNGWPLGTNSSRRQPLEPCFVVYAVGFGVEKSCGALDKHSYWRNDDFNQLPPDSLPTAKRKWIVSGMGDGALIDLQRLTIESFRQGRIVRELFSGHEDLIDGIKTSCPVDSQEKFRQVMESLRRSGLYSDLDKKLDDRLREDTEVILNGHEGDFSVAIGKSNASLLNRFMAHRLYGLNTFTYVPGHISNAAVVDDGKAFSVTLDFGGSPKEEKYDGVVFRHGTERHLWLSDAGYERWEELKTVNASIDNSSQEWEPGWWAANIHEVLDEALGTREKRFKVPREFISPVTEAIASTFVKTVAGMLASFAKQPDKKFRVALHRVIPSNRLMRYQQISSYGGTRVDDRPEETNPLARTEGDSSATQSSVIGRVFSVRHLAVGLCIRGRRPYLLQSVEGRSDSLLEDMRRLHIDDSAARQMETSVQSLVTIPFFADNWMCDGSRIVSMVLYADSDSRTFFDASVLNPLMDVCLSFKEHLVEIAAKSDDAYRLVQWDCDSADFSELRFEPSEEAELQTLVSSADSYGKLQKYIKSDDISELTLSDINVVDFA